MSLIETHELEKNIEKFKIIDSSWHMPQTQRNGFGEYKIRHIPNAIFFDIDKNSNSKSDLPHMLVNLEEWQEIVSSMGIENDDEIVVYDNSDVISSCRCWFNFIYYGHEPKKISVLNGGLNKWINERKITIDTITHNIRSNYKAVEKRELVKNKKNIDENILKKNFEVIDARSLERFEGKVKEPRAGLRSGSIKNSYCIPFNNLINLDKTFKNKKEIFNIFNKNLVTKNNTKLVFTCGSGVTACVLALAYSLINDKYLPTIYDGSWAEYGKI
tara:strand:- start:7759 stop:8574 length:816 start_codon:yes stop_codon:yes gene_type:complete